MAEKSNKPSFWSIPDGGSDTSKMLEAVRMARLSDSDIQTLIEVLLAKQTGTTTAPDEWTKVSTKHFINYP